MDEDKKIRTADKFSNLVEKATGVAVLQGRALAASRMKQAGGDAFLPDVFARRAKRRVVRVSPAINLTLAATTTFADGDMTFTNVGDRDTLVWGFGIELHGLNTATNSPPLDGVLRQLRALASLTFKFPNGKPIPEAYAGYDLGALNVEQDGVTTLVAVARDQVMLKERLLRAAGDCPLGYLNPTDVLTISLTGITGTTPADSMSGVAVSAYLLLEDFPSS